MSIDKNYESIIEQIKKVKELAERGVDGEKENAKILLDKLLKKWNISIDELVDVEKIEYKFKYKTDFERRILFQCVAKYAPDTKYSKTYLSRTGRPIKNVVGVELSKLEFLDIEASTKFYTKLFSKDLELFFTAFISKHDIYGESKNSDEKTESNLSIEEIESIVNMMRGLSNNIFIPPNMLHIELYSHGTTESVWWKLDSNKPENLLDITELLNKMS